MNCFGDIITIKTDKYDPKTDDSEPLCVELESLSQESGELLLTFNGKNQKSLKNIFGPGDILFGKLRPYQRKYYLADFHGVCSTEIWVMKSSELAPEYLYSFIQSNRFLSLTEVSSGSKMPRADWKLISKSLIYFPKESRERLKIGRLIQYLNLRIQTQIKIIEEYRSFKKGLTQKIFKRKLRFKNETGKNYPKWEEKKMNEVLYEHKLNNVKNQYNEVFSVSKEKGVINQIEHLGRSYSADTIEHYKLIEPFDIVYTKSPTSKFPFGIVKQNQTGRTGVLSPLYGVYRPKNRWIGTMIHSYFLSWVNTYNYLVPLVQKGAKNTMNINNSVFLHGKKISLPNSSDEQQKIASFLSTFDEKIELETKILEEYKLQKQYLLQNLFV